MDIVVLSSGSEGEQPKEKCIRFDGDSESEVILLSSNQDSDVVDLESDLSGEESEVGPSQVKILDPTSSIKKHPTVVDKPQVYLHGLPRLPIHCQVTKLMSTHHCINVLLDPELNPNVVCGHVPFGVNCNSSFVVDLNRLSHPKDILCDVMGAWKWSGSYRSWLSVDELGDVTVVGKEIWVLHLLHTTKSGNSTIAANGVQM